MAYDEGYAGSLLEAGLVGKDQLKKAANEAGRSGDDLRDVLVRFGYCDAEALEEALGSYLGVDRIKLTPDMIDRAAVGLIPEDVAVEECVMPIRETEEGLQIAISGPLDDDTREKISFTAGRPLLPVLCLRSEVKAAIRRFYAGAAMVEAELADEGDTIEYLDSYRAGSSAEVEVVEDQIIDLVDSLIAGAIKERASDIHIEPTLESAVVRYRVDGILRHVKELPGDMHEPVVSRLKILASLDIAERRHPLDGVIFLRYRGRDVDLRVATAPTIYGEGMVLRILDQTRAGVQLTELGFSKSDMEIIMRGLAEPFGFILSTGPTGSGKTTSMYAMLNKISNEERKIVTIEDPVEYRLAGINQLPVRHEIDLGFAPLLRSVLRQDPNIILVGEIRDEETAHVAVQAALTGHLLLSTLHTNDAPEVLLRLMEIGIEYFYVREVVKVIIAQRLMRKLCTGCKEPYEPTPHELAELGMPEGTTGDFFKPGACEACQGTGYMDRTGVFEVMPMTEEIKDLMAPEVPLRKVREMAYSQGVRKMWLNAVDKVLAGETSVAEIMRAVPR
ncbi:MAG: GspE/PulE family protein [Actinobacteria bacterium]|nr:GspE/PulE family protein [Actinomycetota bacterium]MBU1944898.1 GspE/PulE family protein [Actinomycetota bacterium]MBU2688102.1 GspE/PulE family protein [Actinomycetota bacterium]